MAIVYQHRRLDTGDIFYVGIGIDPRRPYQKNNRNSIWKNITNKTAYQVEILFDNVTWEEACRIEVDLISKYGRIYLNEGTLANMSEGGQCGTTGMKRGTNSPEHNAKISATKKSQPRKGGRVSRVYRELTTGVEGDWITMREYFPGFGSYLATGRLITKGRFQGLQFVT